MRDELLEGWRTNDRINLYLIDHITSAGMRSTLSKRGGRDVARQFAHMHNNRVWHLDRRAKDLAEGLEVFESKVSPAKGPLRKALGLSSLAIETYLTDILEGVSKRRGLRKGIFATFGYLVAHESHHRGSILLTLKECGHNLDNATRSGIWGWDQM